MKDYRYTINTMNIIHEFQSQDGDQVTFVYDSIVSQQMIFAIFFFYLSFKILLNYIDHVPWNQSPIP